MGILTRGDGTVRMRAVAACVSQGRSIRRHAPALLFAAFAGLSLFGAHPAQAETFDLLSFTPPSGQRSTGADFIAFTDATSKTFSVYGIYRSIPGTGDAGRDFLDEWNNFVAKSYRVTGTLKTETVEWPGGWKRTLGSAAVFSEKQRNFTALMAVFTGYRTKITVFVNYNDERYRPAIDRFLAGLRLTPPPGSPAVSGRNSSGDANRGGASQEMAPGFTFVPPAEFSRNAGWYVASNVENRGGGREITSALVRIPPAIRAQGSMDDALRTLWGTLVPAELKDRAGIMVFRRYVGDGLAARFISGLGRENGKLADTLFTLYLVDCGGFWQPVLAAQTYEEPDSTPSFSSAVARMGSMSFGTSAQMVERFLSALRCPGARGRPLADSSELAAAYSFGTSSSLQWVNVNTGSLSMTAVTYGGTLDLKPDGTYDYRFTGASGAVGAMNVQTDNGRGRWSVQGDLLVLDRDNGKQTRYRIAGIGRLQDGSRAAVFMLRLDLPVNPTTVTNGGDYYSEKVR